LIHVFGVCLSLKKGKNRRRRRRKEEGEEEEEEVKSGPA